ncbi:ATP-binding protein [Burkholderia cenocepacia]|jgi:putative ATP-dependent endonuclease of OLD family|uniref:AAA family ATPase n=1 Tax=Burkholderia cepacia complex TaxID=87882 RepID=UPI0004F603DE|nr:MULTISPECIES: AAA family ATPase [Burkholderia cepacia complex]AIO45329.1 sMC family protein [Burkholderia cepacia]KGC02762.1 sMC family protein [Burkholderia cepacia]MCG0576328.1 ATP-binding protein [Burkholderia cenocepacia]MCW3525885.1 ATP-binding protein [Burkholderia cenocepacia]MCW3615349.1 ATP-binding protein [Burkholderia cenocepacia]
MYLKHIRTRNYRAFRDGASAAALHRELKPRFNILVGENDAGKTDIVDSIRKVLLTISCEPARLFEQDFNINGANCARTHDRSICNTDDRIFFHHFRQINASHVPFAWRAAFYSKTTY